MTRPLTVAVDGRTLFDEVRRGIAKTTIWQYRELAHIRPEWQFHVYYQEGRSENPFTGINNIHCHKLTMKGDRFRLWERIALPLAVAKLRPDVFHAIAALSPRWLYAPLLTTINDLIPIEQNRTDADALRWAANVNRTARRAKVILTPSEFSKGKIVELCGVAAAKVHVVPWASMMLTEGEGERRDVSPPVNAASPPVANVTGGLTSRRSPADRYILHFGMADPRKNTAKLIAAWAKVPTEVRAGTQLQIVGLSDSARVTFAQQCQALGLSTDPDSGSVGIFGYVREEEVQTLLAGAALLAYPTEYEGFGLPILDGFAAGVPVLTGQTTSLPEVAGDAAMLVNVHEVGDITRGLTTLLQDDVLRAVLIERGRQRAKLYTWRRVAEATAELMEWISLGPTQVRHGPMAPT
jgi:glycosyltransferase involved in cell wall biosynthesis